MYRTTSTHAQHTHTHSYPEAVQYQITPHTPALLVSLCLFPHEHFTLCVCVCVLSGFFKPICAAAFASNSDLEVAHSLAPHVMLLFFLLVFPHHVFFFVPVLPSIS